ncbi:MAG: histidine kinase dimerization/phospho-acceptor domain-containing protein, partial [Nocardioidaceae bacterium]
RRLQRDLELLGSVATASNSAHSLDGALADALSAFCRYGGWELGRAHLTDEREPTLLRLAVSHEQVPGRAPPSPDPDEETAAAIRALPAAVLRSGRPETLTRPSAETAESGEAGDSGPGVAQGAVSACAFPVLARDEVVGVLEFLSSHEHVCDDRAREAMRQVGAQVGRVVERDRAERRLARHTRQLERLTRELESVLNSAGEGIYGIDAAGTVTFANETAARLVGRTRTEMLGRPVHEVLPMELREAAFGGPATDGEVEQPRLVTGRHRRADGSSFESELIAAPILEDGVAVGSVVVFRDITERREVDRMKDEFISMVSHELRTPLTSIRGALGLLEAGAAGEIPPRAARMVEVATVSTNRLIRLINDILDMERMSAGKLAISTRPVRAYELVQTAAAEMTGLAESCGVDIRLGDSLD